MDVLKLKNITKSFYYSNSNNRKNFVIKNLSLNVPKGKITALIGGNGVGKTSLFNIISGFSELDSGEITFYNSKAECNLLNIKNYKRANIGIGRMFQTNHIFHNLTVMENMLIADESQYAETPFISLIFNTKTKKNEEKRKEKAINILTNLFGDTSVFLEKLNDKAGTLSFGQQRILSLARLFMKNYNLILLDEPTAGVNPKIIAQIIIAIRKLIDSSNATVFLIEHNMNFVAKIADVCAFMNNGSIEAFGETNVILNNDDVRDSYLGTHNIISVK